MKFIHALSLPGFGCACVIFKWANECLILAQVGVGPKWHSLFIFLGLGRGDLSWPLLLQGWPGISGGVTSYAVQTTGHRHPRCHWGQHPPRSGISGVQAACGEAGEGGASSGCLRVLDARSWNYAFPLRYARNQRIWTVPSIGQNALLQEWLPALRSPSDPLWRVQVPVVGAVEQPWSHHSSRCTTWGWLGVLLWQDKMDLLLLAAYGSRTLAED